MLVYTISEARQKLASVLDQAEAEGKVLIRRKDGRTFALTPEQQQGSPLDVPSIKADISTKEIVSLLRKERGRAGKARRRDRSAVKAAGIKQP
jgi:antitoxin (DNA-binding transcriptional repressor) of toxin-antitoxin stability system